MRGPSVEDVAFFTGYDSLLTGARRYPNRPVSFAEAIKLLEMNFFWESFPGRPDKI